MIHYHHINFHYHKDFHPNQEGCYSDGSYVIGDYNHHEHKHEHYLYRDMFGRKNHHLVIHYHYHEHFWVGQSRVNRDTNTCLYQNFKKFVPNSIHHHVSSERILIGVDKNQDPSTPDDKLSLGIYTTYLNKLYYQFNNGYSIISNEPGPNEYISYDVKHFKISIFKKVWDVYKSLTDSSLRDKMKTTILPLFTSINWMTMSRLYNPEDTEFIELYGTKLNMEFSRKYNPLMTQ